jgi:hypothetical protein
LTGIVAIGNLSRVEDIDAIARHAIELQGMHSEILILNADSVRRALPMRDCIDAVSVAMCTVSGVTSRLRLGNAA